MASRMLHILPPGGGNACADELSLVDAGAAAYSTAMQAPFDLLKNSAAQLAGVLVLAAAGSRMASPDHPILALALQGHEEAVNAIRSANVPRRGAHHHRHMSQAAKLLGQALVEAKPTLRHGGAIDVENILPLLRRGWQELQSATRALPGFAVVDIEHACCAHHGRWRGSSQQQCGGKGANGKLFDLGS
jgi:hypothetical protein